MTDKLLSSDSISGEMTAPELFPWHQTVWQQLGQQIDAGTLAHAILLVGPKGVGKAEFARALAARLLCESPVNGVSCGACKRCLLFVSGTHGDFRCIEPEKEDAALKIEPIRGLVDFFAQSSQQGGKKVAMLGPAEDMTLNAANALLKTLEEPPGDSHIILVSHAAGRLMPTIRSRCQVHTLGLPDTGSALAWLKAQCVGAALNDDQLSSLLALAGGAPLLARSYVEAGAHEHCASMMNDLAAVLKRDLHASAVAEKWGDELAQERLFWLQGWLARIIRCKLAGAGEWRVFGDPRMFVYLAEKADTQTLFGLQDLMKEQYRLLLGSSNPNKTMLFESILFGWQRLMVTSA
jgi:DNA polymerase-3 subunit delta'